MTLKYFSSFVSKNMFSLLTQIGSVVPFYRYFYRKKSIFLVFIDNIVISESPSGCHSEFSFA